MNFFEKFNKLKNKKQFRSNIPTIIFIGSFALLFIVGGTSYAYLTDTQSGTLINTVSAGNLALTLENESSAIVLNRAVPQTDADAFENNQEYTFSISNTGTILTHYEIYLSSICSTSNTYVVDDNSIKPDICMPSEYVNVGIKKGNGEWSIANFVDDKVVIDIGQIDSQESTEIYTIKLWLDIETPNDYSAIDAEGSDRNVLFVGNLGILGEQTPSLELYSLVASQTLGTDTENNIDYSAISSDTNGKGVYAINNTSTDKYPVYFYRGAVTNNNIVFGKFCWKIVRTTSTGGVKLIYNGEYTEDNKCNNTGTASQLSSQSKFNSTASAVYYVGYYYDTSDTMTTMNNGTAKNTTPSTIATAVNTWYASGESGMTSLTYMLENEKWCNDRTNDGSTYFGARTRLNNAAPSIECPNNNDTFTLSVENGGIEGYGNNVLPYPVGLITADEMAYAGGKTLASNTSYYLYTESTYWISSPYLWSSGSAYGFGVNFSMSSVNSSLGVRPSVSLIPGAEIEEGNTGTADDPYIVVLE